MADENRTDEVEALRREVEQLKAAQAQADAQQPAPAKTGMSTGAKVAMWTAIVLLVVIAWFLFITYDQVSGNFDERNYGAPVIVTVDGFVRI